VAALRAGRGASALIVTVPLRGFITHLDALVSVAKQQNSTTTVVGAVGGKGIGEALTFGWDTETSASQNLNQSILSASTLADGAPLLAGGTAQLRTTIHNTGVSATEYTLVHTIGSGLCRAM
jgi:hypothetical protein